MKSIILASASLLALVAMPAAPAFAQATATASAETSTRFTAERVFDLEFASDPQISPDGTHIAYVRRSMDKQSDTVRGDIWIIDVEAGTHRPLIVGGASKSSPRWSPDGTRLLYATASGGKPDLRVHFMDTGESFSLAQFEDAPRSATWSPDGLMVAFWMFAPAKAPSFATPIARPEGAQWAEPVRVFDDIQFRFDGQGYLREGATHVFTVSSEGGSPRQITHGEADFTSPAWLDGDTLLVVGNAADDRDMDPIESEIYAVELSDLSKTALTTRDGPDFAPVVSPNGRQIAFLGYDDEVLSYQANRAFVMDSDGTNVRQLAREFDRSFDALAWSDDGATVFAQVENLGDVEIVAIPRRGNVTTVATGLGGTSIGRPYASGSFTVSATDEPVFAYTAGFADRPAEVASLTRGERPQVHTSLNADLLPYLDMAPIEEFTVESSVDGLEIEAWVALPPDFTADGTFPMIIEIHGGPFAMYGPTFAAEIQRFAAEGYVTVYVNPRGSTGYGEDFAQLIDQAYPGDDYQDLMDVVDDLVARNYVSEDRLFVTGGSGGGILTAWIVGKTDRFAAAASIKPVINWMTMALAADIGQYVRRHWIRADPWTNPQAFLDFSPIMLMDNVTTPTLVMVGEEDWRTPTWEAEQYYTALHMSGVDTALIRVPGASHSIAARPSNLIAKTDNIMGWFERYDPGAPE